MTIEADYQRVRAETRKSTAREILYTMMSEARACATRQRNLSKLTSKRKRDRRETLTRAVARMHVDDLDAAWRAALRGEVGVALARVADHVVEAQAEPQGTPWRLTGWLSRRA